MCFDEFCEYTGDLSTYMKIEMKKHIKRSNLERKRIEEEKAIHRRSIEHHQPIDRQEFVKQRKEAEPSPIDRGLGADRSANSYEKSQPLRRSIAD